MDYANATPPSPAPSPVPVPAPSPSPSPSPIPGPGGQCAFAWQPGTTYKAKENVSANGRNYIACWENAVDPAANSGNGKPWQDLGACTGQTTLACAPPWKANQVYANAGTSVSSAGANYRNKWWSAKSDPATNADGAWEKLGPCK